MPRPRKSIHLSPGGKSVRAELIPMRAETEEQKKRLAEAYDLVAEFIRLVPIRSQKEHDRKELRDAA